MKSLNNCITMSVIIFIIFMLCVCILQFMKNSLKEIDEKFTEIIQIHYEEEGAQYLYKFDLSDDDNIHVHNTYKLQLNNMVAMFPYDDNSVFMLDSTLKLYFATITNTNDSKIQQIELEDTDPPRPVKVVSTIVGNNVICYVLTDIGTVYKYDSPPNFSIIEIVTDAIDIAVNSKNKLFYITNNGEMMRYIETTGQGIVTHHDFRFTQIVSNRDTELVYGLTTEKNIYVVSYAVPNLIENTLTTLEVQFICCKNKFAYITDDKLVAYDVDEDNNVSTEKTHNIVKTALIFPDETNTDLLYVKSELKNDKKQFILTKNLTDSTNLTNLTNLTDLTEMTDFNFSDSKHPFKNLSVFTGTSLSNIFVLVQDEAVTCPGNLSTDCPGLCSDADMEDSECVEIFNAFNSLISNSSS